MHQWIRKKNIKTSVGRRIFLTMVFVFLIAFFVGIDISPLYAQNIVAPDLGLTQEVGQNIGMSTTDIRVIIARIIRVALGFLGVIFLVLTLYGGFLWMTAGGNDEKITSAKRVLINGTVGLVLILSAYSITLFIMRLLGLGGPGGSGGVVVQVSEGDSGFYGSGALGTVIRDHYPGRDQVDVPRNAKIIVTFRPAVLPSSFINDSNANGIFGDCINIGANMNWENDCDRLKSGVDLVLVTKKDDGTPIRGASAIISYEGTKAYTVVIRPLDYLGSDVEKVAYDVRIGKNVLVDDPTNNNPSIFAGRPAGRDFYLWAFICNNVLDLTPPHVKDVYPANNTTQSKNSVIQINFDKPMDPSVLQGSFSAMTGANPRTFALKGNAIFLKTAKSTMPTGKFRLVNNYQTLEFASDYACGQNACGGTVYCMRVCDDVNANGCTADRFEVLLRAAQTFNSNSFESVPFTGVADVSGNALDGDNDGRVDTATRNGAIFQAQLEPDNFFWDFNLTDQMDLTAPYLNKTTPGPNATYVAPNAEWSMVFSKRMRAETMYNIGIEQKSAGESLCRVPRTTVNVANNTTYVKMEHCSFNDASRNYYYPVIDSSVEDVNFNCFYPGWGPSRLDQTGSSNVCDGTAANCCTTNFCCINAVGASPTDIDACLKNLRDNSP